MRTCYNFKCNDVIVSSLKRKTERISKFVKTFFFTALLFALLPAMTLKAQSNATTIDLAYHANASYPGYWSCAGNIYTIVANVTVVNSTDAEIPALTFTISTGVTVQWEATATPSYTTSPYLITLNGGGEVEVTSCIVSNTKGTGGVFNITGAGTTLTIDEGASVISGRGGNPVLIAADNVTLNVNFGGEVQSDNSNSNATLMIQDNRLDAKINVNGGSIVSVGSGYAISDGAAFNDGANNNTQINISDGTIIAGTACAIRSAGNASVVSVSGGMVSNAAGNNANPTIYMNSGSGENVIVSGGTVQSSSAAGYAIQTVGNVRVSGGLVSAINGRAINLVGENSEAIVTGGAVRTTGTGTAISTATTNPETVPNASITVTGGTVSSENGFAINITGANSTVTVSGTAKVSTAATSSASSRHAINAEGVNSEITINGNAEVSATAGYAVNAVTNATNAKVVVDGDAKVSSSTNRAINTMSANSSVAVNGSSQVWTFSTSNAINSNGTVTLNSGFVFGYGTTASGVVNAATVSVPSGSSTMVVAWNRPTGSPTYAEGSTLNLSSAYGGTYSWHNIPPYKSGISYNYLGNLGFFHIPEVAVVNDFGLMFDAATGNMYYNISGSNTLTTANQDNPYPTGATWIGVAGKLTLEGFSWSTGAAIALTIVNGNVIIELEDNSVNYFASHPFSTITTSVGISTNNKIEITGSGMLSAFGSHYGINCSTLTISGGTVEASGTNGAFSNLPSVFPSPTLPATYTYWTNSSAVPPSGEGTQRYYNASAPGSVSLFFPPIHPSPIRYVKIVSGAFALVDDTRVSGEVWTMLTTATEQATITLYGTTISGTLLDVDVSGWLANVPAGVRVTALAEEHGSTITLTFRGTPAAASDAIFDITIPQTALNGTTDLHVIYNPNALFDILSYDLTIEPDANGIFYVKEDGTGNGSSWADAYPNVADPLLLAAKQWSGAIAVASTDTIREIWVAKGTYYPLHSANGYNMATKYFLEDTPNNRDNAFVLVKDVQLYGGFPANANDTDNAPHAMLTRADALKTRNLSPNHTILSGDIGTKGVATDNCYHVVISAGAVGTACINGFTIADGMASGGGTTISVNSQTIIRERGGGIYNASSSPALTHLTIGKNYAFRGGGMYNDKASPILTHLIIRENDTPSSGNGGGIYNDTSSPILTNVVISGNRANSNGGGIYNNASSPILTNVTISRNRVNTRGGGMYNDNFSSPQVRNSIIWDNTAVSSGPNVSNNNGSTAYFAYSLVEGSSSGWGGFGTSGGNNIDADPLFINRPTLLAPTNAGDYRLHVGSPCINAGSNTYFNIGQTPDLSDITTDLDGSPRIVFTTIDMGAYETQMLPYFCGGLGTKADPYQICNARQLEYVRYFLDKHFILNNDIDATDGTFTALHPTEGWWPLADNFTSTARFTGSFNGKGYKITNFWINRPTLNYVSLFGYISNAQIDSLELEIRPTYSITGQDYVGALVSYSAASSIISNCYTAGEVSGSSYVGGLVGQNQSSNITNCYSTSKVRGTNDVGGLVGVNNGATISNSYAAGTVKGNSRLGGLAGRNNSSTIRNCVAANDSISGTGTDINRFVGQYVSGTLTDNYANEDMKVNDATVSGGAHNNVNGANEDMETLKTLTFYNTAGNWNGGAWSIDKNANPATIWRVCDGNSLPFFQWQTSVVCPVTDPCLIPFSSGTGTATDPYIITTPEELDAIRCDLAAHYKLDNDITLTGDWTPIGEEDDPFTGVLDGAGHTIFGLKVVDAVLIGTVTDVIGSWGAYEYEHWAAGLFAIIDCGIVRKLTLVDPRIEITATEGEYGYSLGTVAGAIFGAQLREVYVYNPTIKINNAADASFLGGVVGYAQNSDDLNSMGLDASIINGAEVHGGKISLESYDESYARNMSYLGGIAGAVHYTAITNTAVYGTVIENSCVAEIKHVYAGGTTGYTSAEEPAPLGYCLLNNLSMAIFDITDGTDFGEVLVGGIAGWVREDAVVNNLYIGNQGFNKFGDVENDTDYIIAYNYQYPDAATALTANPVTNPEHAAIQYISILDALNDVTPATGGMYVAATVTNDDTGYGMKESLKRYKTWISKPIAVLGDEVAPAFGAYMPPPTYWIDDDIRAVSFTDEGVNYINIKDGHELGLFAYNLKQNPDEYNGYTITLTDDIDLLAHLWMPVRMNGVTIDGDNHTVSGMTVIDKILVESGSIDIYGAGMFYLLGDYSVIKDMTFDEPTVTVAGRKREQIAAGVIAGFSRGGKVRDVAINQPEVKYFKTDNGYLTGTNVFIGGAFGYAGDGGVKVSGINGMDIYGGTLSVVMNESPGSIRRFGIYIGGIVGLNYRSAVYSSAVFSTKLSIENEHAFDDDNYLFVGGIAGSTSTVFDGDYGTCLLGNLSNRPVFDIPDNNGEFDTYLMGGIAGNLEEDDVVTNLYVGDLYDTAKPYDGLFGYVDAGVTFTVEHNYGYVTIDDAWSTTPLIYDVLNDDTDPTGAFWKAAKILADDSGTLAGDVETALTKMRIFVTHPDHDPYLIYARKTSCSEALAGTIKVLSQPACNESVPSGSIYVEILAGGSGDYSYFIDDVPQGDFSGDELIITGLQAGNYTIKIVDNISSCHDFSHTLALANDNVATVAINIETTAAPSCSGAGALNVTVRGAMNYTYRIDHPDKTAYYTETIPQTTVTFSKTGIPIGEYLLTIIDRNGCEQPAGRFVIGVDISNFEPEITISTIAGDCDNGFIVIELDDLVPLSYYRLNGGAWIPFPDDEVQISAPIGNHTIEVMNEAETCISTLQHVTVPSAPQPNSFTAEVLSVTPASCGLANGAITLKILPAGTYFYSYDTYHDEIEIDTESDGTYQIKNLMVGFYNIRLHNEMGAASCEYQISLSGVEVTQGIIFIAPPAATSPQTFCDEATVANLQTENNGKNIFWYASETSGLILSKSHELEDKVIYYAGQNVGGCSSERTAVKVIIDPDLFLDAPNMPAPVELCEPAFLADIPTYGNTNLVWYEEDGTLIPSSLYATYSLADGDTYYVAQSAGGTCESEQRTEVNITFTTANPLPPVMETPQHFCEGVLVGNLAVPNNQILWYKESAGGDALEIDEMLEAGTYYAVQKAGDCKSATRVPVVVVLDRYPQPVVQGNYCWKTDLTLGDLVVIGSGIRWYDAPGGSLLPLDFEVDKGASYWATQSVEYCESDPVKVTILATCYEPYGTVFPFTHTGNSNFDGQIVTTAKLYMIPPSATTDKIGYIRKQAPVKAMAVSYYDDAIDKTMAGAPKNPGTIGCSNNPGLPIRWDAIGITNPGTPNAAVLTTGDKRPTAAIGKYIFEDVASGSYVLEIARQGFLPRYGVITVPVPVPFPGADNLYLGHRELLGGDVNGDLVIDARDLSAIYSKCSSYGKTGYDWKYDINGDGSVNGGDAVIIRINMGAKSDIYQETEVWINP